MRAELHQTAVGGRALAWRNWPRHGAPPVLALHCALAHGGAWSGLAGALPGLDFHAPDLAGHGRMPPWDGRSAVHDDSTAMARALARRIGRGLPVDVLGHSFGGTVALRLALESPDLVRRLVLIEPVLFAAGRHAAAWPEFERRHRSIEARFEAGDVAGALADFHAWWGAGEALAALAPQVRAYMQARLGIVMSVDRIQMLDALGLTRPGRLEALDRPVLLVEGTDSPPIIAAVQAALARRLPGARRQRIDGAGHMLPITHAPALAAAVGEFLSGQG